MFWKMGIVNIYQIYVYMAQKWLCKAFKWQSDMFVLLGYKDTLRIDFRKDFDMAKVKPYKSVPTVTRPVPPKNVGTGK